MKDTEKKTNDKWYFKNWVLVVGFLCVGPLTLPLVWFNPRFNQKTKIVISVVIVIITYFLTILMYKSIKVIFSYYEQIFNMM